MKKIKISATNLRLAMFIAMVVILLMSVFLFYIVQEGLYKYSLIINAKEGSTDISTISVTEVNTLEKEIQDMQDKIGKMATIAISNQSYGTQAINDLKKYASDCGITILDGYTFVRSTTPGSSTPLSTGLFTTLPVNISLANPVDLSNYIKFLKLIETNIPKMQISGINISKADGSKTQINVEPFTVEVYTR